jgi:hypothetical protein
LPFSGVRARINQDHSNIRLDKYNTTAGAGRHYAPGPVLNPETATK